MKIKKESLPLFYGLSHIGQVFSILWSNKISSCSVFEDNKKLYREFKKKKFSDEEPTLKQAFLKKKYKIHLIKNKNFISQYSLIFFSIDTPLDINGKPLVKIIENQLSKLISLSGINTKIIFLSQVYPGFLEKFYKKNKEIIKKNIQIIYMVDTLVMGDALNKFLKPKQLIFGISNQNNILYLKNLFKHFKCQKFFFNVTEAEIIKMSINLYLAFSVNFANVMDSFCNEFGFSFSKIINPLRNDNRIGTKAYIQPSLGLSGGHLERDIYYIKNSTKKKIIKKIFSSFEDLNIQRKRILINVIKKINHKKNIKILILGISYKKNSFSVINSIFSELFKNKIKIEVFDTSFKLTSNKLYNVSNNLKKSLRNNYFYIFNYLDEYNKGLLINHLKNYPSKYLININNKEISVFCKIKNCINIFETPIKNGNRN
jgi:UDPglucose 6-dehydrogenase